MSMLVGPNGGASLLGGPNGYLRGAVSLTKQMQCKMQLSQRGRRGVSVSPCPIMNDQLSKSDGKGDAYEVLLGVCLHP